VNATERVFRTPDGRLVPETDPDAAFLKYAVGDEIAPEDAQALSVKSKAPTANKMRAKPADKSGSPDVPKGD
jgi:hypothetical protein